MRHADPRALEFRLTVGRVLALTGRALLACRWHLLLIGAPSAIASLVARWATSSYIEEIAPTAWQGMLHMWQSLLVQCLAYVSITFAALSHLDGRILGAHNVLRLPGRRRERDRPHLRLRAARSSLERGGAL